MGNKVEVSMCCKNYGSPLLQMTMWCYCFCCCFVITESRAEFIILVWNDDMTVLCSSVIRCVGIYVFFILFFPHHFFHSYGLCLYFSPHHLFYALFQSTFLFTSRSIFLPFSFNSTFFTTVLLLHIDYPLVIHCIYRCIFSVHFFWGGRRSLSFILPYI